MLLWLLRPERLIEKPLFFFGKLNTEMYKTMKYHLVRYARTIEWE